jgi:mono/diheme cytochrome c family protein
MGHLPVVFKPIPLVAVLIGAIGLAACGSEGVQVSQTNPQHAGAVLFAQRCSGCHTLSAAGTEGSSISLKYPPHTAGPNLNQRKETVDSVLFALRNGGFSGAIMPQNIVVGAQAEQVANFVATYAGRDAKQPPGPAANLTPSMPPKSATKGTSAQTNDES